MNCSVFTSMKSSLAGVFFALFALCSQVIPASAASYVVKSLSDSASDPDSLRYAITQINASPLGGSIVFAIPSDPNSPDYPGPPVITLSSTLPHITKRVVISGANLLGVDGVSPTVQIDGSGAAGDGLVCDEYAEIYSVIVTGFSGSGIVLSGSASKVYGCFIGIDALGNAAANGTGITVYAGGCLIGGGTGAKLFNVISGNTGAGVALSGTLANGNMVRGNLIGTDPTGASNAVANQTGISIDRGASGSSIGSSLDVHRNIISGNSGWGVLVQSGSLNSVENNLVGTDAALSFSIANGASVGLGGGISVDGARGTKIKRNLISGNGGSGVQIVNGASETLVIANNIGVDGSGTVPIANSGDGVQLGDTTSAVQVVWSNTIGAVNPATSGTAAPGTTGTTGGWGNVISGNLQNGVNVISGSNDSIQGNYIGISADGQQAIANSLVGVQITGTNETVGGTQLGAGNVISGNGADGILLASSASIYVIGNLVGLDPTGIMALANAQNGIELQSSDAVQIGGLDPGARNLIGGNGSSGVIVDGDDNAVLGNYIGLGGDGLTEIGNGSIPTTDAGVLISSGSGNVIGGGQPEAANVIVANNGDGVRLDGNGADGNTVTGNTIGFNLDGSADTSSVNAQSGIGIYSGASNNLIGDVSGGGNLIACITGNSGVLLDDLGTGLYPTGNSIRGNSILNLGTDLPVLLNFGANDASTNAPGTDRLGPNNLLDFPVIASAALSGSTVVVSGTYPGVPNRHIIVDLYHSDPNAATPVSQYVASVELDTDGDGNAPFSMVLGSGFIGQTFTATAVDASGNTSQYSPAVSAPKAIQFNSTASLVTVSESAGVLHVILTRQGDISSDDTVAYSTRGISAVPGVDYTESSGVAFFAAGRSTTQIDIPIRNNTTPNGERLFSITLADPSSGVLGWRPALTVSILDNQAPNGVFTITAVTPFVDEGTASAVSFVVRRSGGATTTSTVDFATVNGTALSGKEYTSKIGRLSFRGNSATPTGVSTGTITIPLMPADAVFKSSQTFTVMLKNPSSGCLVGNPGVATETICDLRNPVGTLEFSAATFQANEIGPVATATVARMGGTSGTVTVRYATSNGSALAGTNYRPASGILTFKPGQLTGTISVPTVDDHNFTALRQFNITLSTPGGGATLGARRTASVTLLDSDNPAGVLQFAAPTVTAVKAARTVAVKVVRLGGVTGAVSVPYTFANGTARSGINFTGKAGVLAFANGQSSATINVPLIVTAAAHPALTFSMSLGTATNTATLGLNRKATVILPAK